MTQCAFADCVLPAQVRVSGNTMPALGLVGVLIRPLQQGNGDASCLDHAHHAVDVMVARSLDAVLGPPRGPEDERLD